MKRSLLIAARAYMVAFVVLGLAYPLVITGAAQLTMAHQANGSMVSDSRGAIVGSELIGQAFASSRYFHPRPSAAGTGYDALASGGSNLGPTSRALSAMVTTRVAEMLAEEPGLTWGTVPVDAVTASASGLDPDISPAYALAQVPRVARERNIPADEVRQLVLDGVRGRDLGIFGELRVNVLALNMALDERSGTR